MNTILLQPIDQHVLTVIESEMAKPEENIAFQKIDENQQEITYVYQDFLVKKLKTKDKEGHRFYEEMQDLSIFPNLYGYVEGSFYILEHVKGTKLMHHYQVDFEQNAVPNGLELFKKELKICMDRGWISDSFNPAMMLLTNQATFKIVDVGTFEKSNINDNLKNLIYKRITENSIFELISCILEDIQENIS